MALPFSGEGEGRVLSSGETEAQSSFHPTSSGDGL